MIKFKESLRVDYFATKDGRIISQNKRTGKRKYLKPVVRKTCKYDSQGYFVFGFKENGKNKQLYIHRVVADIFVQKPDDYSSKYYEVNHKDGNKHNNNCENLEWITRSENTKHAHNMGLIKKADVKKHNNPNFKNTKHPIDLILKAIKSIESGKKVCDAARDFGIDYKLMWSYWSKRHIYKE